MKMPSFWKTAAAMTLVMLLTGGLYQMDNQQSKASSNQECCHKKKNCPRQKQPSNKTTNAPSGGSIIWDSMSDHLL